MNCLPEIARRSRANDRRRGTAVVEFAVVAPVFFLMVLGIIEFGRALMVQTLLTNAAEQGARTGALNGTLAADVTTTVNNYLANGGITGATSTSTPNPPSSALPGQSVRVTVTIPYSSVTWLPTPSYLANTTLSSTAVVQREAGQ